MPHAAHERHTVNWLAFYQAAALNSMLTRLPMEKRAEVVMLKNDENRNVLLCMLKGMSDDSSNNDKKGKDIINLFEVLPANTIIETLLSKDKENNNAINILCDKRMLETFLVIFKKVQDGTVSKQNLEAFLKEIPERALVEIILDQERSGELVNFLKWLPEEQRAMMLDRTVERGGDTLWDFVKVLDGTEELGTYEAATAPDNDNRQQAAAAANNNNSASGEFRHKLGKLKSDGQGATPKDAFINAVNELKTALEKNIPYAPMIATLPGRVNELLQEIDTYTKSDVHLCPSELEACKRSYQSRVYDENEQDVDVLSKFDNAISKAKEFEVYVQNNGTPAPGMR